MRQERIDASQLELEEKVVSIKRVTKVVKGGRNMRFTALVVVGDGNGHVGAALGKATEIPEAIRKGKEDAMKKLVYIGMDENNSVPHDFIGKYLQFFRHMECFQFGNRHGSVVFLYDGRYGEDSIKSIEHYRIPLFD